MEEERNAGMRGNVNGTEDGNGEMEEEGAFRSFAPQELFPWEELFYNISSM